MGCCDSCIKYLLFIFNLIFCLSGLAILVVGAVLLSNVSSFQSFVDQIGDGLAAPQIVLIVVGCIIFVVAFLGCCGAITQKRWMLITFAVLLITIFIIELVIGIYALTNFSSVEESIRKVVGTEFLNQRNDAETEKVFGAMERALECCGTTGPKSYSIFPNTPIPKTCCKEFSEDCARSQIITNFNQQGCQDAMVNFLVDAGKIIGGVAIALSVIEIVGASFAIHLSRSLSNSAYSV